MKLTIDMNARRGVKESLPPNIIKFDPEAENWSGGDTRMFLVDTKGRLCDWDDISDPSVLPTLYAVVHDPISADHADVRTIRFITSVMALSQPIAQGSDQGLMTILQNDVQALPGERPYQWADKVNVRFQSPADLEDEDLLLVPRYDLFGPDATTWSHTIPTDNTGSMATGLITPQGQYRYKHMAMRSPLGRLWATDTPGFPAPFCTVIASALPNGEMYYYCPWNLPVALSKDGSRLYWPAFQKEWGEVNFVGCFVSMADPYTGLSSISEAFLLTADLYREV